ncbi:MAG: phosphatidylglycerophosphatase A [Flavobacteriaceae bacterium]
MDSDRRVRKVPSLVSPDASPGLTFMLASPWHLIALGAGAGLSRYAPGTLGSILGLILGLLLAQMPLVTAGLVLAGLLAVGAEASRRSSSALGEHDHNAIVIDEVFGMAAVAAFAPAGWIWLVLSFALFRVCDSCKPWPVFLVERRFVSGFGIMADDAAASVYALAGVWALRSALS